MVFVNSEIYNLIPGKSLSCSDSNEQLCSDTHTRAMARARVVYITIINSYLTKCVCMFGVFRPTREFFTHLEMSPLVKGCIF